MKTMEIIGTAFDWDAFKKVREERWKQVGLHIFHCKIHNTYFDPNGYVENDYEDAEPCWQCYNEFERIL